MKIVFAGPSLHGAEFDPGDVVMRGPAEMKYYGAYVLDPDGNNVEAGVRE